MNEVKVSIIVPVYNVSQYLRRCLESCINQTMDNIEIIIVNDCSPDPVDSDIMREYAERYPDKVKCFWHVRNMRLGEARNTGIRAASGEFIYCVDSDDYIEPTLCERMYRSIVAAGADMAVCDTEKIETDKTVSGWESNGEFESDDMLDRMKSLKMHAAWLIMIRKSVIVENDLFFPPTIGFEDIQCALWFLAAKKITRVHEILHHYIIRDSSITQAYKLETYQLSIETAKILFTSNYYKSLPDEVKGLVFLYIMHFAAGWLSMISRYYPDSTKPFCVDILMLEDLSGSRTEAIQHDSEHKRYVANLIEFIRNNISSADFTLEFIAYLQYQQFLYSHRVCRKALNAYKGKRITVWGAGKRGVKNANMLTNLGVPFELTDGNEKLYGTKVTAFCTVKSWAELCEATDVVFVSVVGRFEEVRDKIKEGSPQIEVIDFEDLAEWRL